MFFWFRAIHRSGGMVAVFLALLGLAFYGIARLSVMIVDRPERAFMVLAVFLLLSAVFCLFLRWTLNRLIAQIRRPLESAREVTSRLAEMGGSGGRAAFRAVGEGTRAAGGFAGRALGAIVRVAAGAAHLIRGLRGRRGRQSAPEGEIRSADVIPLRRSSGRGGPPEPGAPSQRRWRRG